MKIAILVSGYSSDGRNVLTQLGRLQMADLILRAAKWFGCEPGLGFANEVIYFSANSSDYLEAVQLASGMNGDFANHFNLKILECWGTAHSGSKASDLIEMLEQSERKFAFIFGFFSKDKEEKDDHTSIDQYLSHWGIEAEGLPGYGPDSYMYLIDTVVKSVEHVSCCYSQR